MKARRCSATLSSNDQEQGKPIWSDYGASVSERLVSVIPTFRPPPEVLETVEVLRGLGPVVVSDDSSPCTYDQVLLEASQREGVTVIRHRHNKGVARGLNDGLEKARSLSSQWLLTVDQDSTISGHYVTELLREAAEHLHSRAAIGVLGAGCVLDASGPMKYPVRIEGSMAVTEEVIQSGSLWRVSALTEIGGFDETLGSDAVDAAACLGLRESGYVVAVARDLSFGHRIGSATQHQLLGRQVMVTHHSRERHNAMLRNRLRLLPREVRQSPLHAVRTLRRVVINRTMGWLHSR